jgi:hypothetical protein
VRHTWNLNIRALPAPTARDFLGWTVGCCLACLCRVRRSPKDSRRFEYLPKDVEGWENATREMPRCL